MMLFAALHESGVGTIEPPPIAPPGFCLLNCLLRYAGGAGPPPVTRFRRHSFLPQMTELSRDQVFIRHGIFNQTIARRKIHQTIDGVMGYFGVIKRRVTFDEAGYQLRLIGWE